MHYRGRIPTTQAGMVDRKEWREGNLLPIPRDLEKRKPSESGFVAVLAYGSAEKSEASSRKIWAVGTFYGC